MMAFTASLPIRAKPIGYATPLSCPKSFSLATARRARARIACVAAVDSAETKQLVDKLLESVKKIDGGPLTSKAKKAELDELINRIIAIGDNSGEDYLSNPLIFGQYSVAYTGGGRGNSAAGGAFRSALGRLFFVPRGAFQHIFQPDVAVNLVAFRLFGFISGVVGLYGAFSTVDDMGKGGLRVRFRRPRIRIGPWTYQFSNESEVKLRVAYLDERVRIAVGGRGSLFVFTRGGIAEQSVADEWKSLFGETVKVQSQQAFKLLIGLTVGVVGGLIVSLVTNLARLFMG